MKRWKFAVSAFLVLAMAAIVPAQAQQVTAIRAGKMFDPRSGANLTNQVVLITGDKITEVGPADRVKIPAGAKVIDLSQATVLPGLIDGHVHLTDAQGGLQHQMMVALFSATASMNAGYTTLVSMGTHGGGYGDVELKKAIEAGLDDLRHGRSVEGAVGLASIDKRLADWRAKQKNDAEPDEVRDTL